MKRLLFLSLLALPALAFAQGTLAPTDAPAPTMKTLAQLEPRTPLRTGSIGVEQDPNGGVRITSGGSYYLDGNIVVGTGNAITVLADNVTIDLNGFTLASFASPTNGIGVFIDGTTNATIRNGYINGGFDFGIAGTDAATGVEIEDVGVSNIGLGGIYFLPVPSSAVRHCTVTASGSLGIAAGTVFDSRTDQCANVGIYSSGLAQNCFGQGTKTIGLQAKTAINCTGISTDGVGLYAAIATGCTGTSTSGIGLQASQSATGCSGTTTSGGFGLNVATLAIAPITPVAGTAENCTGSTTGSGTGLSAGAATNCLGTSTSGTGLFATTASNCIGTSTSGMGLHAATASNCSGTSTSGERGLYIIGTASYCRGKREGGIALSATTAIGCTAEAGDFLVINRYLMP